MPVFSRVTTKSRVIPGLERIHTSILVGENELLERADPNTKTFYDIMARGRRMAKGGPCLGYRRGPEEPYVWLTYEQVFQEAAALASGLVEMGLEAGNNSMVGIYGINSPEWMLTNFATVANSMLSVPIYHTFDADSLKHVLKQTQLRVVFCDTEQRLLSLAELCREAKEESAARDGTKPGGRIKVDHFVLMKRDASLSSETRRAFLEERGVRVLTFDEVLQLGRATPRAFRNPTLEDVYMICYTSGTTGSPKGVVLTHGNLVAGVAAITKYLDASIKASSKDRLISFLPLAHIYEQVMEAGLFYYGGSVGYYQGDILKLMDDARALRPTIFPIVPRLLSRLVDRIKRNVSESGRLKRRLFKFAFKRKQAQIERGDWGRESIWDKIVFKKIHALLGGRVRFMSTGSAPVSPEVLKYARVVFGAVLFYGYGQTECSAAATITLPGDASVGHVGVPAPCCQIKLIDALDMGYLSSNDRGEVCIRGPAVMKGYFEEPEKTAETLDGDGWLRTGDIGRWTPGDGCLQIIDRKKQFFKLSQGDYVAPEKIENVYATCPLVSQIFVHGSSLENHLVAIVVPEEEEVRKWIDTQPCRRSSEKANFAALCDNDSVKGRVLAQMRETGKRAGLSGLEQVKTIHLWPEPFSPENGLLTPTLKNKRPRLLKGFLGIIEKLYAETNDNRS